MKIVCPSCEAAYEVPERALASGRKMRCARCGGEWVPAGTGAPQPGSDAAAAPAQEAITPAPVPRLVEPPALEEAPALTLPEPAEAAMAEPEMGLSEPAPEPRPILRAERPTAAPPPAPQGVPVAAWAASLALVAALVAAALIFRGPIIKAWPPSGRLLATQGKSN